MENPGSDAEEIRRLKAEVLSLWTRIDGMAHFSEDTHLDVARLGVWLLTLSCVCAAEAAAIAMLWWFR